MLLITGFFSFFPGYSIASTNVHLNVEGCNNNNICESFENNLICSNDCNTCNGNNVCEPLKGETKLLCPADCKSSGNNHNFIIAPGIISNIDIISGINYAIISWDSDVPSYGSVSWGIGDGYNGGSITNTEIVSHHLFIVENLSASTTYSYLITSSLPDSYYVSHVGNFTTLSIPEIKIIPSIYNLTATTTSNEIILSWKNPDNEDFDGVKIVRSPFFFPLNPDEGKIIYEGKGIYVRDSDIIFDQKYYYSAFSYDKDLHYSSGVLVQSILKSKKISTSTEEAHQDEENKNTIILPINHFVFSQNDLELPASSSTIVVYPYNDLKIIIDAKRFPVGTKTLILKIQDQYDISKSFSYSFVLDNTKNFFYANVPNFFNKNIYAFSITSYGSDYKIISETKGFFDVRGVDGSKQILFSDLIKDIRFEKSWILYFGISLFGIFCILFLGKKIRDRREEKEKIKDLFM